MEGIGAHTQHAVIWYITLSSLGAVSFFFGYILHLIPARSDTELKPVLFSVLEITLKVS